MRANSNPTDLTTRFRRHGTLLGMAAAFTLLVGCPSDDDGGGGPNPTPTTVTANPGGDGQSATAGTAVAVAPGVTVRDQDGNLMAGVAVAFAVASGGGSVTGGSATTNSSGVATVGTWTLGATVGANSLTATVTGVTPVTFNATGTTGPASQVSAAAGNNQDATVGMPVAVAPAVRVTDANNNPVAGVQVDFAVTGGGGAITAGSGTTDADGEFAIGSWTLGDLIGANTCEATVAGIATPFEFTATGTADMAATIVINAGDNQTAGSGSPVAVAPSVLVEDMNNNPVEGATVMFAVASGNGSVTGATQQTDAAGIATVGAWTLGDIGANTLTATTGALPAVTFNATAELGPPATIAVDQGDNQSAEVDTDVALAPAVLVTDAGGNPVPGVDVTYAVSTGGGSITGPATVQTDAGGVATVGGWTLGTTAGANTLTATATGAGIAGNPVTFTATGTAGAPASVVVQAGDNQTATTGTNVAINPAVLVEDDNNNPVAGVDVTYSIQSVGGAIVGPATVQTDAGGIATVGGWTLGAAPGANELLATVTGAGITGNPITFTATGEAGPAEIVVNAGDNQTATVNTAVATPPSVLVTDAMANPVQGVDVTFAVATGGGSISGAATVQTDASGIATVGGWTLGQTAGANSLTATADGMGITGNPVTFNATGTAGAVANMAIDAGNNQSVTAGVAVPIPPSVLLTDQFDNPVAGEDVTFAPSAGGMVTGSPATSDAAGIATVGSWTVAAGANTLTASTAGAADVVFSAMGTASAYQITLDFQTALTANQMAAFTSASARWSQVITGDLADITVSPGTPIPANSCGDNPVFSGAIDDLYIWVFVGPIDGAGSVLGRARPCYVRTTGGLSLMGMMEFDSADLPTLETNGTLNEVILHEMGHVIGIGTLWTDFDLLENPSCGFNPATPGVCDPDNSGADTYFSGAQALTQFNAVGGDMWNPGGTATTPVPIENNAAYGPGTRDAHWRESTFVTELMSGIIAAAGNPLSAVTVGSLEDLGYMVNIPAADPYTLGDPNAIRAALLAQRIDLGNDVLRGPLYQISETGEVRRIR